MKLVINRPPTLAEEYASEIGHPSDRKEVLGDRGSFSRSLLVDSGDKAVNEVVKHFTPRMEFLTTENDGRTIYAYATPDYSIGKLNASRPAVVRTKRITIETLEGSSIQTHSNRVIGDKLIVHVDFEHVGAALCQTPIARAKRPVWTRWRQFIKEDFEPSYEFLTAQKRNLFWDSQQETPVKADEVPGIIIPQASWSYTYRGIERGFAEHAEGFIGTINQKEVHSLERRMTYDAGKVLVSGVVVDQSTGFRGDQIYNVTINMNIHLGDATWNTYPGPLTDEGLGWRKLYDEDGNEVKTYKEKDFSTLLITAVEDKKPVRMRWGE